MKRESGDPPTEKTALAPQRYFFPPMNRRFFNARMSRRCALSVLLIGLLQCWLAGFVVAEDGGGSAKEKTPARIVSQSVLTDELLLAVARPEQVIALSQLARDDNFSAVSEAARAFPQLPVRGTAEAILQHRPTLVLFSDFSRPELVTQVKRTGVTVLVFDRYATLEDTYGNLRRLGAAIDPDAKEKAEAVIAATQKRVTVLEQKLAGRKIVKVIAPSTYGVIPGAGTNFQDLCEHAGAENLAATLGKMHGHTAPPAEQMLRWPIDRLVIAVPDNAERPPFSEKIIAHAVAPFRQVPPYKFMSSVKEKRIALLQPWQMSCLSHLRVEAYEQLARQLHPEAFQE